MSQRGDKEFDKFVEGTGGEVCVIARFVFNPITTSPKVDMTSKMEHEKFVELPSGFAVQMKVVS